MEYEVGKYYKVKCVEVVNMQGKVLAVLPVIGEPHRDPQFGSSQKHYHLDGRFLSKNAHYPHLHGKTNYVVWCKDESYDTMQVAGKEVYRRLKCKRTTTGLLLPGFLKKYQKWYDTYVGKSCKGKKCPHLGHEMREIDGVLVCPLHNLRGCPVTEIIIQ